MASKIFLAHAREDKERVKKLYSDLKARGFVPWLDEIDLIPGQIWKKEIPQAIRQAGVFLACLSSQSVAKIGFVQNEFRLALAAFGERPAGSIYLIPVRLDDCEVPDLQILDGGLNLRDIHWVDLWEEDGFDRLVAAIERALGLPLARPEEPPSNVRRSAQESPDRMRPTAAKEPPAASEGRSGGGGAECPGKRSSKPRRLFSGRRAVLIVSTVAPIAGIVTAGLLGWLPLQGRIGDRSLGSLDPPAVVAPETLAAKRATRGWLGIRVQAVTDEIADSLGLSPAAGALVADVTPGGPADTANLEAGDVILEFNGETIDRVEGLVQHVARLTAGTLVPIVVWHHGERSAVRITVGETSDEPDLAELTDSSADAARLGDIDALGLTLSPLTEELKTRYELAADARGVVIVEVREESPAGEVGVRPGEIIVDVGQEEVSSLGEVAAGIEEARQAGRKSILLLLDNQGDLRFTALRLPASL